MNVRVSIIIYQVNHVTANSDEVRYDSIVHESMSAEDEGMVIDSCYRRSCSGTNVGEDGFTGCICADAAKVGVVKRGLSVLVEGRVLCVHTIVVEIFCRRSIPRHSKPINIEKAVASGDLKLCCDFIWVV